MLAHPPVFSGRAFVFGMLTRRPGSSLDTFGLHRRARACVIVRRVRTHAGARSRRLSVCSAVLWMQRPAQLHYGQAAVERLIFAAVRLRQSTVATRELTTLWAQSTGQVLSRFSMRNCSLFARPTHNSSLLPCVLSPPRTCSQPLEKMTGISMPLA